MKSSTPQSPVDISAIERVIRRFTGRLRLQRAVTGAVEGACLGLMLALIGVAAMRTGWADPDAWWVWALITVVFTASGALIRALRPIDALEAAQTLDRTHDLHDRLSTAIALAHRGELTRQDADFVEAQLQDALHRVDNVDPRRASPWRTPADTRLLAVIAVAVILVGLVPTREHTGELPPPFQVRHGAVLDDVTLALERDRLEELRQNLADLPDEKAEIIADEIEALLNAVENREITEREFLEAIDEILERHFGPDADSGDAELDTLAEVLAAAAQQIREDHQQTLDENPALEEAMTALEEGDFQSASEALAEFAEELNNADLSAEEAERLADLLESFADQLDDHQERLQELFEQHRDAFQDLAEQFGDDDREALSPEQQDLLNDARDAMEQAERQRDEFDRSDAKRRLETLSRELDSAADDAREEGQEQNDGQSDDGDNDEDDDDDGPDYKNDIGRKMDDASRQLEEMENQRQISEQREQARQQLEEMRESMARQNRDASQESDERRGEQMQDFMDRARGEESDDGGEGDPQQLPELGSDGDPGQQGDETDEGGTPLAQDPGQDGDSQGDERGSGSQPGEGGPEGEIPNDDSEEMDAQHQAEMVQAQASEEGRTRSEIIRDSGEEGFATVEYRDVYADYEAIAEEVMEREEVPDGYRFYIKRYFQLIRPQQ